MKKAIISTLLLMTVMSLRSYSQNPICDYITDSTFITPDTVYLNQTTDSMVTIDFMNNSHVKLDYAFIKILFNDTSYISLDSTITHGFQSPFPEPFSWDYTVTYKQSAIPSNTILDASFNIWTGKIDTTYTGCNLPLTFIINSTTVSAPKVQFTDQIEATVFPNPVTENSVLRVKVEPDTYYNLIIYDAFGRKVHSIENLTDETYLLKREYFRSAGIYFTEIQINGVLTKRIKILVQ